MPNNDKLLKEMLELKRDALALRREIVEKTSSLATAAFGLVAALAWNGAIQALFRRYYAAPDDPNALLPLMGYAVSVTIVGVIVIILIGRSAAKAKKRLEAAEGKLAAQ